MLISPVVGYIIDDRLQSSTTWCSILWYQNVPKITAGNKVEKLTQMLGNKHIFSHKWMTLS